MTGLRPVGAEQVLEQHRAGHQQGGRQQHRARQAVKAGGGGGGHGGKHENGHVAGDCADQAVRGVVVQELAGAARYSAHSRPIPVLKVAPQRVSETTLDDSKT
ncbi:hypothetical protein G6F64_014877 [Rhizopus arrhizus]|uniref:Uncharacterized protein n=1 Tax=Rhizopus oryzae TaxID=64495 RepID=A0A9P6WSL4_RHIOR|nr:hypothetical protein G6F64_014877 [Rhizopus arrhizus]